MTWISAAVGAVGAGASIWGGQQAARVMEESANAALQLQREQYQRGRADLAPWRTTGGAAASAQARALGLPQYDPGSAASVADTMPRSGVASRVDVDTAFRTFMGRAPTPYETEYYTDRERADQLYTDVVAPGQRKGEQAFYTGAGPTPYEGEVVDPTPIAPPGAPGGPGEFGADPANLAGTDPEGRYGGFYASPGYQFRREEGLGYLGREFAAGGQYQSGARLKAGIRYSQNVAAQEFDQYMARLSGVSGQGLAAAGQTAQMGQGYAAGAGQAIGQAGQARASGYLGAAGAISSGANAYLAARPYMGQQGNWAGAPAQDVRLAPGPMGTRDLGY